MHLKIAFPFLLCMLMVAVATAQDARGKNDVGIQAGGLFYLGDLSADAVRSLKTARPVVSVYYSRSLSSYFSLRANLALGSLMGDDSLNKKPAYMRRRKFRFNSPLSEASLLVQYDLFGSNYSIPATRISPYIFAGVGASFVNINRDWSRADTSLLHAGSATLAGLLRDNATAMPKTLLVVPVGAGVKYHAWQHIALTAEVNYRFTFTDYLDGFSYAANPNRKDSYYSITVGAVYNFGKNKGGAVGRGSVNCPKLSVF